MFFIHMLCIKGDKPLIKNFIDEVIFQEISLKDLIDGNPENLNDSVVINLQTHFEITNELIEYSKIFYALSIVNDTIAYYHDEVSEHQYTVQISHLEAKDGIAMYNVRYGDILDDIINTQLALTQKYPDIGNYYTWTDHYESFENHIIHAPDSLFPDPQLYRDILEYIEKNKVDLPKEIQFSISPIDTLNEIHRTALKTMINNARESS